MGGVKQWWQSRAVIGGAVAGAIPLLNIFGVDLGDPGAVTDVLFNGFATVGGALAIYGRVKATTSIGR